MYWYVIITWQEKICMGENFHFKPHVLQLWEVDSLTLFLNRLLKYLGGALMEVDILIWLWRPNFVLFYIQIVQT